MKKLVLLGSSLLAAAMLAVPAQADEYGRGMMKSEGRMGMMKGECMMDMGGMHGDCPMMGAHSMTGTVAKIDHDKGMLTLKHGAGDMRLHFPPAAIKDLKNGDTITVNLGFARGSPAMMK
jgi:hypothetical protein